MDEEGGRLMILFVFQCSLFVMLESVSSDPRGILVWQWQQLGFVMLALRGYKNFFTSRPRRIWAYDRGLHRPGVFYQNLLGSFNAKVFKGRMRMDVSTFEYLCSTLASHMVRQDTVMRLAVRV
jgi:hypothetical protein